MESQKLDIVELIELNPITKLSKNYQGKFIEKIQRNFTETQQKLFIASFYTYLNYNSKTDFVIELENIWKWLGFSRKEHCKVALEKHFTQETDYKIFTNKVYEENVDPQSGGAKKNNKELNEETILLQVEENKINEKLAEETILPKLRENKINEETRGRKKEKILMTIHTFKKLCLKSNTKKADEIHDYFIKLEELTHETITEESIDLKLQLENQKTRFVKDRQQILLDSYHIKCIVYLIKITMIKDNIEQILYKFGNTDDIIKRLTDHTRDINKNCSIELIYCIESKNNVQLENELKEYLKNTNFRKEYVFKTHKNKNKKQTELIEIDDITIIQNKLILLNKSIQEDKEYLVIERLKLEIELEKLKNKNEQDEINEIIEIEVDEEEKNEQEIIDKEFNEIKNLAENTKEEKDDKINKLKVLKIKQREQSRIRVEKFRQTEKYKLYIQSDEYKQKERERYQVRKQTDEFKQYRKEYYQNNRERLDTQKLAIKRKKSKTTLSKSQTEKNKFKNWLNLNVKQENKGKLIWLELINKFLGYRTSALISKTYKEYFIEWCSEKFPVITTKYIQFKLNEHFPWGYRNFTLNIQQVPN
jgi:hypothetical protein